MAFQNWSLKSKVTFVIVCTQFLGLGALAIGASFMVTGRFSELESREVSINSSRLAEVIQEKMSHPAAKIPDWANWDDTFSSAKEGNKSYETTNLIPGTLDNVQVDSLKIFKRDRTLLYSLDRDTKDQGFSMADTGAKIVSQHPELHPDLQETKPKKAGLFSRTGFFLLPRCQCEKVRARATPAGAFCFSKGSTMSLLKGSQKYLK